ncbi:MAG: RNA polymerase sigma factor [Myxococcota bacterium]
MKALAPVIDSDTVRQFNDSLIRFARRRVATDEIARELVQETWLAAMVALPRFAGRSSIGTWLTSILRRKIVDRYRSQKCNVPIDDTIPSKAQLLQEIIARDSARHALNAINDLSPRQREAVRLCAVEDLDREEAAQKMGLSRACLRVTLCRGRRHLRTLAEAS